MRRVVVPLAVLLTLVLSCASEHTPQPPRPLVPDDVMGLWHGIAPLDDDWMAIAANPSGEGYVGTPVAALDSCAVGRRVLEFVYSPADTMFIGRHVWCNADTTYWGDADMVRITQPDRDLLLIRYLDHVYDRGWRYERVRNE